MDPDARNRRGFGGGGAPYARSLVMFSLADTDPSRRFRWLADPYRRRSSLALVKRAVAGGWLDAAPAADRAALVDALAALADAPLAPRELRCVAEIVIAMERQNLQQPIVTRGPSRRPQGGPRFSRVRTV